MEDRIYCEACADLRQQDPNFIANGFSEDNELHMRLDEGLTGDNDDCTDLNNMNDCLVGLMDDEATIGETCDWPSFIHKFVPNLWTVFKAIISSVCGLWTAVHSFWLRKDGDYIYLDAWDGEHGSVIDSDTTYSLSGGGDTVTLVGSDGSRSSVTVEGGGEGGEDTDTTYVLGGSGNTVTLTGSDGTVTSHTVPGGGGGGGGVTYALNKSGSTISLEGSDSSVSSITEARYHLHTKTYVSSSVSIAAGDSRTFNLNCPEPTGYSYQMYPMAVAGWLIEGTGVSNIVCRYIQLTDRTLGSCKVKAVFQNVGSSRATGITFSGEVLWWGSTGLQ